MGKGHVANDDGYEVVDKHDWEGAFKQKGEKKKGTKKANREVPRTPRRKVRRPPLTSPASEPIESKPPFDQMHAEMSNDQETFGQNASKKTITRHLPIDSGYLLEGWDIEKRGKIEFLLENEKSERTKER